MKLPIPPAPPAPKPAPAPLPNPRHLERLPAHLDVHALARIRHAAWLLPQVVKPADFLPENSAGFESHLDGLGYILLQKAAAGMRPSRWIHPDHLDAALAHLAAVGTAPETRNLVIERGNTLHALGVARQAGAWTRTISHALAVPGTDWRIPVVYRVPVDEAVVWAWYRSGDEAALRAGLGAPVAYPHAAELVQHLATLVEQGRTRHAAQLEQLQPRLQSECALPQPLPELKAACSRAFERWAHGARERDALDGLGHELAFQGYPDTFPKARRLQRKVTLYVGPPNSGKTHAAFERLAAATLAPGEGVAGCYLAPLRLLALEGRDRLAGRGVACSLLTGEENVPADGARAVSSTIEMVGTGREIEVAVIDEAQMIFDGSRGWAWTQAIAAVPAREVIIICSAFAVPAIENLLGLCGERVEVRHFERKQHVQLLGHPVPLVQLKQGDAVVAFSRRDVLMLRDQIAAAGHAVSVIYGALPPEVRRREAERYAQGESAILVATDAIGMGLNLPIRRVLFSTLTKFDGQGDRRLDVSEVHQIAGRAGRYGIHEEGFCGVLSESEPTALRVLKDLLPRQPQAPRDFKAPVAPNGWHVDTIAERLGLVHLREVLGVFVSQLKLDNAHFAVAELEQMLELAAELDQAAPQLTLRQRFTYAQAPVDLRTDGQVQAFLDWAHAHAQRGQVDRPWFLDAVDGHSRLERMEQALRAVTLWLWLDLRFPGVYGHLDEVLYLRGDLNDGIERTLKAKRPLAQQRRGRGKR